MKYRAKLYRSQDDLGTVENMIARRMARLYHAATDHRMLHGENPPDTLVEQWLNAPIARMVVTKPRIKRLKKASK